VETDARTVDRARVQPGQEKPSVDNGRGKNITMLDGRRIPPSRKGLKTNGRWKEEADETGKGPDRERPTFYGGNRRIEKQKKTRRDVQGAAITKNLTHGAVQQRNSVPGNKEKRESTRTLRSRKEINDRRKRPRDPGAGPRRRGGPCRKNDYLIQ